MLDVIAAAEYLLAHRPGPNEDQDEARLRRVLETGMVITYARPFTKSRGFAKLGAPAGLEPRLRSLHDQILTFRAVLYAHNDNTPLRQIVEFTEHAAFERWLREDTDSWQESRYFPTPKLFSELIELARANLVSFFADHEQLVALVSGNERPPDVG